jgi:hypothetical protein
MHSSHVDRATGAKVVPGSIERALFLLTALWGASIFWLAEHPPMVDLPQHAGQVMLLRDLVFGDGRWSEVVRLNWFTPYLISYALALPLSLVLPVAAALKLLLSLAYLAFVWMCIKLRRHFAADARLDWLFLIPFFGLAYKWGFLTFLVAAPVALVMVLLSSHYAQRPGFRTGGAVLAAGLLLLASHGLAFAFGWLVGVALLAAQSLKQRVHLVSFLPFALLGLLCIIYFLVSRSFEADFNVVYGYHDPGDWNFKRLLKAPLFTVGATREDLLLLPLAAALFALPWLLGLRRNKAGAQAFIPFLVTLAIMMITPSFAFKISIIYERFAIFLLPAYAWMFSAAEGSEARTFRWTLRPRLAFVLLALTCWLLLAVHSLRALRFEEETRAFDAAVRRLEPHQRALTLVFDPASRAAGHRQVYVHYPSWYQAESGGMVDYNFAWFPPQIVRFRPQSLPAWRPSFEWTPERFDWDLHHGGAYRYFFVRHTTSVPLALFKGAKCPPALIWSEGAWTIFEQRPCTR